jgi:hypothetical protein
MSPQQLRNRALLAERWRMLARDAAEARHQRNSALATRYVVLQQHVRRRINALERSAR